MDVNYAHVTINAIETDFSSVDKAAELHPQTGTKSRSPPHSFQDTLEKTGRNGTPVCTVIAWKLLTGQRSEL